MANLTSKLRVFIQSAFGRTSMGQNGFKNITSAAPSPSGEVYQNLYMAEDTVFTADYVDISEEGSDGSVSLTLPVSADLPGAWTNVTVISGHIVAFY